MALPTQQEILDYVKRAGAERGGVLSQREIARAFGIKGADRTMFRALLKDMAQEGILQTARKKHLRLPGALPPVLVLKITDIDPEGDLICQPTNRREAVPEPQVMPPKIILPYHLSVKTTPPLGNGDRFLGRISDPESGICQATPIKALRQPDRQLLGVFEPRGTGGIMHPASKKNKRPIRIDKSDCADAKEGDIIRVELISKYKNRHDEAVGRICEIVGSKNHSGIFAQLSIAAHDIPYEFPQAVRDELQTLPPAPAMKAKTQIPYEDWRAIPFVTIDPDDARDHDDAIFAETHADGWRLCVAIADVAWYVRPRTAIDREAQLRGNSTYLPSEVVPMLPEKLSTDLCSLKAGKDRPVLIAEMIFSLNGKKIRHRFLRAIIQSVADLSYEEVQQAAAGQPTDKTEHLTRDILNPLWALHDVLKIARSRRAPLALAIPERRIDFDNAGRLCGIKTKASLEAHRLVEEMMVQANICAAETLEAAKLPLIYRTHDRPDLEKLAEISDYLGTLGYNLAKGHHTTPEVFNQILDKAEKRDEMDMISQILLRAQSRAIYDTNSRGHFGLNLKRYAHFTSPIRRYADITIHRALVEACRLDQSEPRIPKTPILFDKEELQKIAEAVTLSERRSVAAERDCADRYLAQFLAGHIGAEFTARISGVTRFGLFVTLDDTGADGFIPVKLLGNDYYIFEDSDHRLRGERHGKAYHMGQRVVVRLIEATPFQGGLRFEMISPPVAVSANATQSIQKKRADGTAKAASRRSGGSRPDHRKIKKRPAGRKR